MSSLSTITTCNLKSLTKLSSSTRNLTAKDTPNRLATQHHHHHHRDTNAQKLETIDPNPKANALFGRRETIGGLCGLWLGFSEALSGDRRATAADGNGPCDFTVAPSGLAFCDKVVGNGPGAVQGQLIKAHYVGKLENGKVFDSSYNRGKPLTFRVGVGEVIKGWDQGIVGGDGIPPMLTGGKRTLKIPPELGYGARGAGCKGGSCIIPPESVLLFDVEFIGKA